MRTTHATLAAAVGAWLAGELQAAMNEPAKMYAAGRLAGATEFDGVTFLGHIDGMLDDLIDLCSPQPSEPGPFVLYIEPKPAGDYEWQSCLQGWARIGVQA